MGTVTPSRRDHAGPSGRRHARPATRAAHPLVPRRERLRAVRAVTLLTVIIIGVPAMLVLLVGLPIPGVWAPAWAPANRIDQATLMVILSGVVWLAWAHFVICVIAEWRSGRRGCDRPPRIPLGGGSQTLAHRLVAATLLFSGTAILLTPGADAPGLHPAITASAVRPEAVRPEAVRPEARGTAGDRPVGDGVMAAATNVDSAIVAAASAVTPLRGVAGSALLAAGVVVALAGRRTRASTDDPIENIETALRLAADVGAARFVDQALRVLSAKLTTAGRTLPSVYAATLTDSTLLLHIAPAEADEPPAPWRVGQAPGHWLIDRIADTPDGLPTGVGAGIPASTPAPYPGLTTVGTDDDGSQILVDVEGAPGIISLGGDVAVARKVAVSIAVELATNLWSDELRVHMIGFPGDPTPIAPNRLRTGTSLGEVLNELTDRESRRATTAGDENDPNTTFGAALRGRQAARTQALWAPDLLVLAAPPSDDEVARLSVLATGRTRGVGVITVGDTSAARWRFTVSTDGRLSLGVLGFDVNALTLPADEYSAIVEMFRGTDADPATWTTRSPTPPALPAGPGQTDASGQTQAWISATNALGAGRPGTEMVRFTVRDSAAVALAPAPAQGGVPAPVPWVPDIPPRVSPPVPELPAVSRRAPDGRRHPAVPPIPPLPPPPPPPPRAPLTAPRPRPPMPPLPPGERPVAASPSHPLGVRPAGSAGSQTIPTGGLPALPPPRSFPVRAAPAARAEAPPMVLPPAAPLATALPATAVPGLSPREAAARRPPPVPPPGEESPREETQREPLPREEPPRKEAQPRAAETPPLVTVDLYRPNDAEIRVLGTITIDAPGPLAPDRRDLLTELVVYLALHRNGIPTSDLKTAIWPHGASGEVVAAALDDARAWLGPASGGGPRITISDDGCWRLADDVRCDWDLFIAYTHRSGWPDVNTDANTDAEEDLITALRLVTGPLWTNLPDHRYDWLASSPIRTSIATTVVDVAHRLAQLTLGYGDTVTAVAACRTGLRAVPTAEVLWRDLLRTVAARRDRKALEAVIGETYRVIAPPRSGLKAQAETEALVRELLSGLRRR
ncbi:MULTISPECIES: bacterial transcriptional activator domain-containing protein [unclassified Frankia]|uniref:bacterial transcriptional activator domain-containing protein n=1 Tax=unclassified Frankia TaxID=2632575 RepID=UPI002AD21DEA|nr:MULTISPECIES: bacterial transcriptional activator domain-containing protein [unclassified Frankia]